jgi:hypothetical protein
MIVVKTRPFSSCVVHLKGFSPKKINLDYNQKKAMGSKYI